MGGRNAGEDHRQGHVPGSKDRKGHFSSGGFGVHCMSFHFRLYDQMEADACRISRLLGVFEELDGADPQRGRIPLAQPSDIKLYLPLYVSDVPDFLHNGQ